MDVKQSAGHSERAATPARPCPVLKDGHVICPLLDDAGRPLPGSRRKNIGELTTDEIRAMSATDAATVAAALIGVLHMKELELARVRKAHAMAELNYWGRMMDQATKEYAEADRVNREGNT